METIIYYTIADSEYEARQNGLYSYYSEEDLEVLKSRKDVLMSLDSRFTNPIWEVTVTARRVEE